MRRTSSPSEATRVDGLEDRRTLRISVDAPLEIGPPFVYARRRKLTGGNRLIDEKVATGGNAIPAIELE